MFFRQGSECFVRETGSRMDPKKKKESDMELCRITRVHPHLSASLHTADIRLGQYFQFSLSVHCGSPIHTRKSEIALFFSLLLMDIKV